MSPFCKVRVAAQGSISPVRHRPRHPFQRHATCHQSVLPPSLPTHNTPRIPSIPHAILSICNQTSASDGGTKTTSKPDRWKSSGIGAIIRGWGSTAKLSNTPARSGCATADNLFWAPQRSWRAGGSNLSARARGRGHAPLAQLSSSLRRRDAVKRTSGKKHRNGGDGGSPEATFQKLLFRRCIDIAP